MTLQIAHWNDRYEVNHSNRAFKDGDKKRVKPLAYIRSKCSGHKQGGAYRHMLRLAGARAAEVFGVFGKLKEFAGMVSSEYRDGTVYNEDNEPATTEEMAWMSGFSEKSIVFAIKVLTDDKVGWLVQDSAKVAKVAKLSKTSDSLKESETETETKTESETKKRYMDFVLLTDAEHDKLSARLGPKQLGDMIERLNGYIGQIGVAKANAKYKSHYHTILNWRRKDGDQGTAVSSRKPTGPSRPSFADQQSNVGIELDG